MGTLGNCSGMHSDLAAAYVVTVPKSSDAFVWPLSQGIGTLRNYSDMG